MQPEKELSAVLDRAENETKLEELIAEIVEKSDEILSLRNAVNLLTLALGQLSARLEETWNQTSDELAVIRVLVEQSAAQRSSSTLGVTTIPNLPIQKGI